MRKNYFLKVLLITLIGLGTNLHGQTARWNGSSSSSWTKASNWDSGVTPSFATSRDVIIPSGLSTYPVISSTVFFNGDLEVQSGATISMNNNGSLQQLAGNFTLAGTIILESESELFISASATVSSANGTIIYKRTLTDQWHLIASPVTGQDIDVFVSAEGLASGAGNNRGLATYTTQDNEWSFYQDGASGTGNFTSGQGYSIKLASAGDIAFTGKYVPDDTTISLTRGTTDGRSYNLVGNPYLAHVNSGNFLSNSTSTSALVSQTIWLWDPNNSGGAQYITKVSADDYKVSPGQGFFVQAANAGSLSIVKTDQEILALDNFERPDTRPEIHLTLSDGSLSRLSKIYYIEGTTTGFDNGFDGPRFMSGDNSFAFFTHLVSDSEGVDYDIQSLPTDNYENMVIPVGINAISGTEISIEASTVEFPEGMNIYLEDKEDDSFTLLDGDANFTTTLANDLNGIGRFYLHTTTGSLSADDLSMNNNISIYNSSRENLRIVGVQNGTAKVQLYNILGKEVFSNTFEGAGVNDIQLPSLSEGLYIVNLSTANGKTNKKIIIQ